MTTIKLNKYNENVNTWTEPNPSKEKTKKNLKKFLIPNKTAFLWIASVFIVVAFFSSEARSDNMWKDVSYNAILPANMAYCTNIGNLDKLVASLADGNVTQFQSLISSGKCNMGGRMEIEVFQQNSKYVLFFAPSGRTYRTVRAFLE